MSIEFTQLRFHKSPEPMTFLEALQKLMVGQCFGIQPAKNTNFMILEWPKFSRLVWWSKADDGSNGTALAADFQGEWHCVHVQGIELRALIHGQKERP